MPFTGKANYDDRTTPGDDVSALMEIFAPTETPLLDRLAQAGFAATDTRHQWTEDVMSPLSVINSTAINSATADGGIQINGGGDHLIVGMVLQIEGSSPIDDEKISVVSIPAGGNSLLVARNVTGTGVDSLAAGGTLRVIGQAQLEGHDATENQAVSRTRVENYTQILDRAINLSGTEQATLRLPNVGSELDYQTGKMVREVMRDLERSVIRGGVINSLGTSTARRSMKGLLGVLATVNSTVATNSFTAAPIDYVSDTWQQAWNNGADDIDLIVCGDGYKKLISRANAAQYSVPVDETLRAQRVEELDTDFGRVVVMLNRWMPTNHLMGVSTSRLSVPNLQGRAFASQDLSNTGDNMKRLIVGEYTMEYHNEQGMFQLHV